MKKFAIVLTVVILIGVVAYFILPISIPIILAFVTAALLEPLVRWGVRRTKLARNWIVLIVFSIFFVILAGLFYLFISKTITSLIQIAGNIPLYTVLFMEQWQIWNDKIIAASAELPVPLINEINKQIELTLTKITEPLRNFDYLNLAKSITTTIPIFLINLLVYLIAVFLFMVELPTFGGAISKYLKDETAEKLRFMKERLSNVFLGFFKAQFLVSVVIFIVSLIGLLIIKPKLALAMALLIWLIDFIPIIGSIVIVAPWVLIEFIHGNHYEMTGLIILGIVLLIIRRTLEPKVMGEYIGLSPLATLIAMFLGVQLIGAAGFIVGPLLLIAYRTARDVELIKLDFKI